MPLARRPWAAGTRREAARVAATPLDGLNFDNDGRAKATAQAQEATRVLAVAAQQALAVSGDTPPLLRYIVGRLPA